MSREERIQENVRKILEENEIYPYSVIYTFEIGESGTLGITLYTKEDLQALSKLLDYKSRCDKSGFIWIEESNTVLLSGLILVEWSL